MEAPVTDALASSVIAVPICVAPIGARDTIGGAAVPSVSPLRDFVAAMSLALIWPVVLMS